MPEASKLSTLKNVLRLKATINDVNTSDEDRWNAVLSASINYLVIVQVQYVNVIVVTYNWSSTWLSYVNLVMSRIKVREACMMRGEIPGLEKSQLVRSSRI